MYQTDQELTYWCSSDGLKMVPICKKTIFFLNCTYNFWSCKSGQKRPFYATWYPFSEYYYFRLQKRQKMTKQAEVLFGLYIED